MNRFLSYLAARGKADGRRPCTTAPRCRPPAAAPTRHPAERLLGVWRLASCRARLSGEDAPRDLFGADPFGYIIFTPERRMMAFVSRRDRRPPADDAEAAALLRSMLAYTGKFRVAGDRLVVAVDGAWSEVYKATEQVRYFAVEGDTLTIRTPEQPSGVAPGRTVVSTLVFERER
jgi:hypothetical protein